MKTFSRVKDAIAERRQGTDPGERGIGCLPRGAQMVEIVDVSMRLSSDQPLGTSLRHRGSD
jgi:hypothetical protein